MTPAAESVAAAPTPTHAPTPILVEKRFPLDLAHSITTIRDLYDSSKKARWDPTADIPWRSFDADGLSDEVRRAARLSWSRRAWVEYTGLPETPALLIRFCLEIGREADPKYYLAVRNTEEAWHVEVCHRVAEAFGGYVDAPANPAYAALFNQAFSKQALGADTFLDGYVAAHCALEDGLELELWRGYLDNARDPVVRRVLELCVEDKKRHAAFGWFYMEKRAPDWSAADRATIADALVRHVREVEFKGYHCAWMAPDGAAGDIVAADRTAAEAGLGALVPEAEAEIVADYLTLARDKFAALGVDMPDLPVADA
jgi:hypothetical protein